MFSTARGPFSSFGTRRGMVEHRLAGLQSLRALAALMVLVGHAMAEAEHYFGVSIPGSGLPWTRGVDIFFVISGFIITLSADRYEGKPAVFLRRRALRVVPMYYLFTTLMVITLLVLPGGAKETLLDPWQILSSYGFFPYERYDGRIAPVLSLGWTLNYEIFFYALFAMCLVLPHRHFWVSVMLLGLGCIGLVATFESPQLTFWTNAILIEFLFGVGLARLWQAGFRRPNAALALILLISGLALLILLHGTPLPRFLAAGLPALLIVAAGTVVCPDIRPPGQAMGDASYALYLSHRFTLRAMTLLLLPALPSSLPGAILFTALACTACVAVSLLVHRHIERPLQRAFDGFHRKEVEA